MRHRGPPRQRRAGDLWRHPGTSGPAWCEGVREAGSSPVRLRSDLMLCSFQPTVAPRTVLLIFLLSPLFRPLNFNALLIVAAPLDARFLSSLSRPLLSLSLLSLSLSLLSLSLSLSPPLSRLLSLPPRSGSTRASAGSRTESRRRRGCRPSSSSPRTSARPRRHNARRDATKRDETRRHARSMAG